MSTGFVELLDKYRNFLTFLSEMPTVRVNLAGGAASYIINSSMIISAALFRTGKR